MLDSLDTRFLRLLRARMDMELQTRLIEMGDGSAADYSSYTMKVGEIRTIRAMAEWIEDVEAEVLGKKRED